MSKFMLIVGILFAAIGLALGLMIFFSPGAVVGWGITPEVAALLLVGGAVSAGLGGVIQTLEAGMEAPPLPNYIEEPPARAETPLPEFGRRAAATESVSPSVRETITALEEAKTNIRQALGEDTSIPTPLPRPRVEVPPPPPEPEAAEVEIPPPVEVAPPPSVEELPAVEETPEPAEEEGQLYVIEERIIRNREARILSDGTVEAETDEGWMRFENLEHLDEYLDATDTPARA
jgi:hypothetical protein